MRLRSTDLLKSFVLAPAAICNSFSAVILQMIRKGFTLKLRPLPNKASMDLRLFNRSCFPNVNFFDTYKKPRSFNWKPGLKFIKTAKLFQRLVISAYFHPKRSASYVLLHDGWPAPFFHWLFAYACESHELFYGVCDEVEMYVSCF
jgi:hypothetical protein